MKLLDKTPEEVVFFLAGSLPAVAHLQMKQLGLFCMIAHLPGNILNKMAERTLSTENDGSRSWFVQIRKLSSKYGLPTPLAVLASPLSKIAYKNLIRSKITHYWEQKLRSDCKDKT